MSLRRRWIIPLGSLCSLAILCTIQAQESMQGPPLFSTDARLKETQGLTRTGARKTMVVAAIERAKAAVVNIHSERNVAQTPGDRYAIPTAKAMNGMGTGIIIDPRGYIVTNQHVVDDVTALRIQLLDGTSQNAVIIARNPELDLAIIKIDPATPLQVMPIGTAHDLMVGETVIAIGNAFGYEHTASVGVVSAVKRDVSLNKEMSYKSLIQTDACINPGNSGGPLINIHGELVGVNVAIRAGAQGIGFAIPVDQMVKSVSEMLRKRRRTAPYDGFACRDLLESTSDGFVRTVVIESRRSGQSGRGGGAQERRCRQAAWRCQDRVRHRHRARPDGHEARRQHPAGGAPQGAGKAGATGDCRYDLAEARRAIHDRPHRCDQPGQPAIARRPGSDRDQRRRPRRQGRPPHRRTSSSACTAGKP